MDGDEARMVSFGWRSIWSEVGCSWNQKGAGWSIHLGSVCCGWPNFKKLIRREGAGRVAGSGSAVGLD